MLTKQESRKCDYEYKSRNSYKDVFFFAQEYQRRTTPQIFTRLDIESEFGELADKWHEETAVFSSISKKSINPHYQRIIGMGPRVVPLILRELERKPGHWFWALIAITGENPVKPEDAGNLKKMTEAWLRLGKQRGWI